MTRISDQLASRSSSSGIYLQVMGRYREKRDFFKNFICVWVFGFCSLPICAQHLKQLLLLLDCNSSSAVPDLTHLQ